MAVIPDEISALTLSRITHGGVAPHEFEWTVRPRCSLLKD
jgi:hypothetical protein